MDIYLGVRKPDVMSRLVMLCNSPLQKPFFFLLRIVFIVAYTIHTMYRYKTSQTILTSPGLALDKSFNPPAQRSLRLTSAQGPLRSDSASWATLSRTARIR